MSRVADGATTRRERILDMLRYIRTFMPRGVGLDQVGLYMTMAHGLTRKKTQEYVYEMSQAGLLEFEAGRLKLDVAQFERLLELLNRGYDTSTELE